MIWNEKTRKEIIRHLESKQHKCGRSMKLSLQVPRDEKELARLAEAVKNFKPFCLKVYDFMTIDDIARFNFKR